MKSRFFAALCCSACSDKISPLIDRQIVTRFSVCRSKKLQHGTDLCLECMLAFILYVPQHSPIRHTRASVCSLFTFWHFVPLRLGTCLLEHILSPLLSFLTASRRLIVRLALPFSPWAAVPFCYSYVFRSWCSLARLYSAILLLFYF